MPSSPIPTIAVDSLAPPAEPTQAPLARRLLAEFLGSALLAAVVIGSGIAAETLSPGQIGLQLLENAAATAVGLFALILMFGPISGAHFNPAVTLVDAWFGGTRWIDVVPYVLIQILGCAAGAVLANAMFGLTIVQTSTKDRISGPHLLSEVVATVGLLLMIFTLTRSGRATLAPAAVGAYIGAAYWFTSSTSFANPAITVGRTISDTFAGIAPASAIGYIGAQLIAVAIAVLLVRMLYPNDSAAEARMAFRSGGRKDKTSDNTAGR